MVENTKVVEEGIRVLPEERRCQHVYAEGRRCGNRRWAGKKLCFQHDPEATELRKPKGKPWSGLRILSATEVHELLARALEKVASGKLSAGRAYAVGYLAQLLLANMSKWREEFGRAKTEWDLYQEIWARVRALDRGEWWAEKEGDEEEEESAGEEESAEVE
jgi:hypothetical protein